ncbi:MAG TPA: GNAT family N-acetyltransferase [Rhizomicrobium sp.]|nr:GNAT family N-acetyltransferase [Rhizomicrobium sp.]
MKLVNSGKRVPMVVTFLEMTSKPSALPPPQPKGKIAILKADNPPVHFYRYLYDTIGDAYKWVDRRKKSDAELAEIVQHPRNELYVLYAEGCPAGMAELDMRDDGIGQLAYFGLMPDYVGRHFGYYFLYHACMNAWARPIQKMLVNTCTLDHPRALPLYQRVGFSPYSREDRYIEMP